LSVVAVSTTFEGLIKTTATSEIPVLLESTTRPVILIVERKRKAALFNASSDVG